MSENQGGNCNAPDHHHLHMCELNRQGLREEIAKRTSSAGYICHNCNAVANRAEDLCNASPFARR